MSPLTLLMFALIGVILVSAVIGMRVASHRAWVPTGRLRFALAGRAAAARAAEPRTAISGWENEGGSIAAAAGSGAPLTGTPPAGTKVPEHGRIVQPKDA